MQAGEQSVGRTALEKKAETHKKQPYGRKNNKRRQDAK